ncbi:hypothetical protein DPMN_118490 [Dreissena polymorpha]|uniref:Uncharacterized protein n=1 Tax=Dreissena polymorpha TaxID=45954 RepID=A0A9D4JLY6_DREPO|nr:hypothetical protein DPMN_118490 [Dreissena polymorpha]
MMSGYQPQVKGDSSAGASSSRAARYAPYSTSHFLSFRHKTLQESTGSKRDTDDL